MNEALQELVELYTYSFKGEPYCQVYFKGRFDQYDTVRADILLGDIVELRSIEPALINSALNCTMAKSTDRNKLIEINSQSYLEVAAVIVACYPIQSTNNWINDSELSELDWKATDIIKDTINFINLLSNKGKRLTRENLDLFTYSISNYIPICSLHTDYRKYIGACNINEISIKNYILDRDESLEVILDNGCDQYALYIYECDLMIEVIMALLHYLSSYNRVVNKCKVCGRYFIPLRRSDEKYCDRISSSDSCKNTGKKATRKIRMQTDFVTKKYNSICTNLQNRIYATKIKYNLEEQEQRRKLLEAFRAEYQIKKKVLSESELLEWMDSWKQCKN